MKLVREIGFFCWGFLSDFLHVFERFSAFLHFYPGQSLSLSLCSKGVRSTWVYHWLIKSYPHNRIRTSDLEISVVAIYSLPLYQLSYARTCCVG